MSFLKLNHAKFITDKSCVAIQDGSGWLLQLTPRCYSHFIASTGLRLAAATVSALVVIRASAAMIITGPANIRMPNGIL